MSSSTQFRRSIVKGLALSVGALAATVLLYRLLKREKAKNLEEQLRTFSKDYFTDSSVDFNHKKKELKKIIMG